MKSSKAKKHDIKLSKADLDLINAALELTKYRQNDGLTKSTANEVLIPLNEFDALSPEVDMVDVFIKSVVDLLNRIKQAIGGSLAMDNIIEKEFLDNNRHSLQQLIDAHQKLTDMYNAQKK